MKTVLSTRIEVSRIAVFAEMAYLERRPELGLLCRAARDARDRRISAAVVMSALPGLSEAGASNVIAFCQLLRLCDAQGGLTALGEETAKTDTAPVPEQGVYWMWLAEHPVMGRRPLAVERQTSTRDTRFENIRPLPMTPDRGVVFCSVRDPRERFVVRELPSNHGQPGCLPETTLATCRLRWTIDFDGGRELWQLDGRIEAGPVAPGSMKPIEHAPESVGLDVWELMVAWAAGPLGRHGRWQPEERRLAVPLAGLTDVEQDSFCKTLKLGRVEVPQRGSYDDVTLEDVPIGPATPGDTQRWAMARLERRLAQKPTYRSRREVRRLFGELVEGTPLAAHGATLPAHAALVDEQPYARDPARFWSLVAPVDLAPAAVSSEELAELRIGPDVEPRADTAMRAAGAR